MLKKDLIKLLEQYDDNEEVYFNMPGYKENPRCVTPKVEIEKGVENGEHSNKLIVYPLY